MENKRAGFSPYLKYTIEGLVIFASVLFSFYLGNLNQTKANYELKNTYLNDLIVTLDDDINQIQLVIDELNDSENKINLLQNDIEKRHLLLDDHKALSSAIQINIALSFFPKKGVFNQMISTGTFELIASDELKSNLLEIYNHLNERNYAISNEIDLWNMNFLDQMYLNFNIRAGYDMMNGEFYGKEKLLNYDFDKSFYLSKRFNGYLSRALIYSQQYKRLLSNFNEAYKKSKALATQELSLDQK